MKVKESESYQAMLQEVEVLIKQIEDPQVDLDQLVQKVERGYELIKKMRLRIEEVKKRIETIRPEV